MSDISPLTRIFEKANHLHYPLNAVFELTHRCNLKCRHCYAPAAGPEMDTASVKSTLAQLAEAGCLFVTFTGGEILCRRDLFEIAQFARRQKMAVKLFTNGTLIDDAKAELIADLMPVDIGVSIHGPDAATHDALTAIEGSFKQAVEGIRRLRKKGLSVHIKLVITHGNYRRFQEIKALAVDLGAELSFGFDISPARDGDSGPLQFRLDREALREVLDDGYLYEEAVRVPLTGEAVTDPASIAVCSAGRNQCAVTPDGRVMPCVMLPVAMGDLRRAGFAEVWNGPRFSAFRALRLADLHDCAACPRLRFCQRCSGIAMLEDGDMLGRSSWACLVANVNQEIDTPADAKEVRI